MEELNGRMLACQILITGRIAGGDNPDQVRQSAQRTVDELFSLMKPPSSD